jgi:hypothetical protein
MLGTGFHKRSEWDDRFFLLWYKNQRDHCPFQFHTTIISTGAKLPFYKEEFHFIRGANLGHIGDYRSYDGLAGWSASFLALCLLAYNCGEDLIYREQDVLAFGPWLGQAYLDLGNGDIIYGGPMKTKPWMPCAQSIVIVRHRFLLEFVRRYIELGNDSAAFCPEHRFSKMAARGEKGQFRHLTFGVDRERPLPWDAPVWYAQQWTDAELEEAKSRGLL